MYLLSLAEGVFSVEAKGNSQSGFFIWFYSLWYESAHSNISLMWLWGLFPPNTVLIANRMVLYKCKSVPALPYSTQVTIKISFSSEWVTGLFLYGYAALKKRWLCLDHNVMDSVVNAVNVWDFFVAVFVLAVIHKQQIQLWARLCTLVGILWSLWTLWSIYSQKGNRL